MHRATVYWVGRPLIPKFLRVPQAVGLYCSCHATQASKGNFSKTYYKTLEQVAAPPSRSMSIRTFSIWCVFCHTCDCREPRRRSILRRQLSFPAVEMCIVRNHLPHASSGALHLHSRCILCWRGCVNLALTSRR